MSEIVCIYTYMHITTHAPNIILACIIVTTNSPSLIMKYTVILNLLTIYLSKAMI